MTIRCGGRKIIFRLCQHLLDQFEWVINGFRDFGFEVEVVKLSDENMLQKVGEADVIVLDVTGLKDTQILDIGGNSPNVVHVAWHSRNVSRFQAHVVRKVKNPADRLVFEILKKIGTSKKHK
jgi:hypothetical protein